MGLAAEAVLPELTQNAVEVADRGEIDDDRALARAEIHFDAGVQTVCEAVRDLVELSLTATRAGRKTNPLLNALPPRAGLTT